MNLKPIKTNEEYEAILVWIDGQFDQNVAFDSLEGEQLRIALLLIKSYEDAFLPVP